MKGKHLYLFGVLLAITAGLLSSLPIFAQEAREIKGTVTDSASRTALPGVSVLVKGTKTGTATDAQGQFTIRASAADVLVFTYLGYDKAEIAVGNRTALQMPLQQSKTLLNETVVIGYGTMKKSSVTASVSKVENTNLDQIPAGRTESALVGRLAGVNISQSRSQPGAAPLIRIRGAGSIDAGNDPLVVIDGIPGGNLGSINMNDVESVEVLKDASSAAIYGSRAAGGVVIVTMKKGKAGKAKFNFNGFAGVSSPKGHKDWINGDEYYDYAVRYQNREYVWVGGDPTIPVWGDARRPNSYQVSDVLKNGKNVIWQDEVLGTAPIQSYNLSASGGSDKATYYVSGTYKNEQGTLRNTWFKTYGVRANVDVKASKLVSLGFMLNPMYSKRRYAPVDMASFVKYPNFVEVRRPDGSYPKARDYWGFVVTGQANPMAILNGSEYYASTFSNLGEGYLKLDLAKGLSFRSSVATNIAYNITETFQATFASSAGQSAGSEVNTSSINLLNENVLSYNTSFRGGHDLSAIAGAAYQRNDSRNATLTASANTFNNDIIHTLNNAIINPGQTSTFKSSWGLVSYFSRVHYAYKEKYMASASIRTDGSSRFGPKNKWGYFPSASLAWRVKQEDFLKNVELISDLKLRASWGVTGNFNIGDFDYLGQIGNVNYSPNNTLTKGQAQTTFGNDELSWEKTKGYDFGVELGLLNSRINLVFDYYDKRTDDLLYRVSVPATTGFTTALTNVGAVRNKGIEIELNTRNLIGAFKWQTNFNFSKNINRVEDLGGVNERITTDTYGMSWLLRVGEPMFSYYGYKTIGVLKDAADVAGSVVLAGSKPGNPKYLDRDGNKKIDGDDRVLLGNFQPKAILGMVNNFSYKNFDLSIAMQASLGAKLYNFENEYYQGALVGAMRRSLVETQWWSTAEQGDGKMPASSLGMLSFQSSSDVYIEDASFLAIRNINLGYTLPAHLTRRLNVNTVRVYLTAGNPFMFTKKGFHGYNPEGYTNGEIGGINSKPGFNTGSEPINRVYAFGFNFNF